MIDLTFWLKQRVRLFSEFHCIYFWSLPYELLAPYSDAYSQKTFFPTLFARLLNVGFKLLES